MCFHQSVRFYFLSSVVQANGIFSLLDRISQYATKWLNVSAEIGEYLLQNDTKANLDSIRNVRKTVIYNL